MHSESAAGMATMHRYRNADGQSVVKLLPGGCYVTAGDEVIDTVLGSCVSACIRNPRFEIGGMNHFMLPRPGGGDDAWERVAGRATRYGSASMEQLINRVLKPGGVRADLEVKLFGGARVLGSLSDIGSHNVMFVRDYLRQEGMQVVAEDLGDLCARQVQYFPATGRVRVRRLTLARRQAVASQEQRYLQGLQHRPLAGPIDLFCK